MYPRTWCAKDGMCTLESIFPPLFAMTIRDRLTSSGLFSWHAGAEETTGGVYSTLLPSHRIIRIPPVATASGYSVIQQISGVAPLTYNVLLFPLFPSLALSSFFYFVLLFHLLLCILLILSFLVLLFLLFYSFSLCLLIHLLLPP
jgi:hypothetical protein